MRYILSQRVNFRTVDGTLWHVDNPEEVVVLQEAASRVLHCLLEHAGQVTTREAIFQEVWEKYDLQPSNNSLNQYIFAIRKAFSGLTIPAEFIQTIPKTGFFISAAEVQVEGETFPLMQETIQSTERSDSRWLAWLTVLVVIAVSGFLVASFLGVFTVQMAQQQLYPIGKIGKCPIYTLTDNEPVTRQKLINLNEAIARQALFNTDCVANAFYIIYAEDRYLLNNKGRRMISRCQYQPGYQHHLAQCKSVYIYEH